MVAVGHGRLCGLLVDEEIDGKMSSGGVRDGEEEDGCGEWPR